MLPPDSLALLAGRAGFHIEGSGQPVVLLHSSMGSKGQWRALVERLRRSHRLIAIDLHGYGDSPMPASAPPFTLHDEVQLIDHVLSVGLLPGERFHLVGHSYGGAVALQLARSRPRQLRSMTLIEPVACHLLPTDHPGRQELEAVRDEVRRCLDRGAARDGAAAFVDYWSGSGTFARLPPPMQQSLVTMVPKTLLDFAALARETKRGEDFRCIDAPTCLLSGSRGPRPPRDVLDVLARVLPHARHQRVAGGHMAPVTHGELVNPLIEAFIRGVDTGEVPLVVRTMLPPRALGRSRKPQIVADQDVHYRRPCRRQLPDGQHGEPDAGSLAIQTQVEVNPALALQPLQKVVFGFGHQGTIEVDEVQGCGEHANPNGRFRIVHRSVS